MDNQTKVGKRFAELAQLQPLNPEALQLLPLVPDCQRRDGDYLRVGVCVN